MRSLYDPSTGDVLRREQARSRALVFGITAVVCGVLVAMSHDELPFLAHWAGACSPDDYAHECEARGRFGLVAGVATTALIGAFAALGHRYVRLRPTLTCRRCGTRGWVLDIEPHGGRCPRCGGERFDYRIWFGTGTGAGPRIERLVEEDRAGPDLVRRFRETRHSGMRRYY